MPKLQTYFETLSSPEVVEGVGGNEKQLMGQMPDGWDVKKNDKQLLKIISSEGIEYLDQVGGKKEHGFEDLAFTGEQAFSRIEQICEFFKDQSN